tara:strand:+ start:586 stop:804 length:219 start_codon:yes stop_codon:yes gene_type:complete
MVKKSHQDIVGIGFLVSILNKYKKYNVAICTARISNSLERLENRKYFHFKDYLYISTDENYLNKINKKYYFK